MTTRQELHLYASIILLNPTIDDYFPYVCPYITILILCKKRMRI